MASLILFLIGATALWTARSYRVTGRRSTDVEMRQQDAVTGPEKPNAYYHHVQV